MACEIRSESFSTTVAVQILFGKVLWLVVVSRFTKIGKVANPSYCQKSTFLQCVPLFFIVRMYVKRPT